jgi:CheY-like chemotaxis protein
METVIPEGLKNRRILLVDDETLVAMVIERFLHEAGFFVLGARSGAEALLLFAESPWDLVITDRSMPEMTGEQLAHQIKSSDPATPIILMSGYGSPVTAAELFDAVLSKPFSKEHLIFSVARVMKGRASVKTRAAGS